MRLLKIYIIGFIAFVLSLVFDKQIIEWSLGLRFGIMNSIMIAITSIAVAVAFVIIGAVFLIKKKKWLSLLISALISFGAAHLLKIIIMRPRPLEQLIIETNYSMPSVHAMVVFAVLPFLRKEKYFPYFLIAAVVISFSRLYVGVHYLSDLIAGAMVGYLIGLGVIWLTKKYKF